MYYEIKLKNIEKNKNHANPSLDYLRDIIKLFQRKTTLKWISDAELSSVDMKKIHQLLANKELSQCVLACGPKKNLHRYFFIIKMTYK